MQVMYGKIETFPCIQTLLVVSKSENSVRSGYITNDAVIIATFDAITPMDLTHDWDAGVFIMPARSQVCGW